MMLTVQEFIDKTKENSTDYFTYMLETLIDTQIIYIRAEDNLFENTDPYFFEKIEKSIKKIKTKQNFFMRFFSMIIPIEDYEDNKKTQIKQLTILFDKINVNIYKLNQALTQNNKTITSITNTLDYLQLLKDKFLKDTQLSQNKFYVNEIDDKILLLEGYTLTLSLKELNLLKLKKVYQTLNIKV